MSLTRRQKLILIGGVAVSAEMATLLVPPLPQDLHYHDFADQRELLGIPNFWNVVSNFPLVLVGLLGFHLLVDGPLNGGLNELRRGNRDFFLGVLLVGRVASAYHRHPSDPTLLWD